MPPNFTPSCQKAMVADGGKCATTAQNISIRRNMLQLQKPIQKHTVRAAYKKHAAESQN